MIIKGEKKGVYNVLLIGTRKDRYAKQFDETGVEYIDEERYRMLTGGAKPESQDLQFISARSAMGEREGGLNPDRVSDPVRVGISPVSEKIAERNDLKLTELSHSGGTTKQYMDPLWAEWEVEGVQ